MTQHTTEFKTLLITNPIYPESIIDDLKKVFEKVIYTPAANSLDKDQPGDVHPTEDQVRAPLTTRHRQIGQRNRQGRLPPPAWLSLADETTGPELTDRRPLVSHAFSLRKPMRSLPGPYPSGSSTSRRPPGSSYFRVSIGWLQPPQVRGLQKPTQEGRSWAWRHRRPQPADTFTPHTGLYAGTNALEEHEFFTSLPEDHPLIAASASGIHVSAISEHSVATTIALFHQLHRIIIAGHNQRKWVNARQEFGGGSNFIRELRGQTVGIIGWVTNDWRRRWRRRHQATSSGWTA
jgi:hypothetical protein